jgi:hypothetical protein
VAAGAEAGVQGAVGVEPGYREREGPEGREAGGILAAHPDDLSVRLEGDACAALAADEAGRGHLAGAEHGVQRSGGQEPRYAEATADTMSPSGCMMASVTPAGGQHLAAVAEGRIQAARRAGRRSLRFDQDRLGVASDAGGGDLLAAGPPAEAAVTPAPPAAASAERPTPAMMVRGSRVAYLLVRPTIISY